MPLSVMEFGYYFNTIKGQPVWDPYCMPPIFPFSLQYTSQTSWGRAPCMVLVLDHPEWAPCAAWLLGCHSSCATSGIPSSCPPPSWSGTCTVCDAVLDWKGAMCNVDPGVARAGSTCSIDHGLGTMHGMQPQTVHRDGPVAYGSAQTQGQH